MGTASKLGNRADTGYRVKLRFGLMLWIRTDLEGKADISTHSFMVPFDIFFQGVRTYGKNKNHHVGVKLPLQKGYSGITTLVDSSHRKMTR